MSWNNKTNELLCDCCYEKIEQGKKYYSTFRHCYDHIHEECWQAWSIDNSSAELCEMDYDKYFDDEE
jgi:hypothetical protein